jgi:hypothetical protein
MTIDTYLLLRVLLLALIALWADRLERSHLLDALALHACNRDLLVSSTTISTF